MTRTNLQRHTLLNYTSNPKIIYLRDGEVVVHHRSAIPVCQCRYKLVNGNWNRVSTRNASVENLSACLLVV